MNDKEILNFIKDDDLRLIAKNASLADWEWNETGALEKLAMIEGAAIMLKEFFDDTPMLITRSDGRKVICWHLLELTAGVGETDIDGSVMNADCDVVWAEWQPATDEPEQVYIAKKPTENQNENTNSPNPSHSNGPINHSHSRPVQGSC
jgi:hypothetical protein